MTLNKQDGAAVTGLIIAGASLVAVNTTGNPIYDPIGSIVVGNLLGMVSSIYLPFFSYLKIYIALKYSHQVKLMQMPAIVYTTLKVINSFTKVWPYHFPNVPLAFIVFYLSTNLPLAFGG